MCCLIQNLKVETISKGLKYNRQYIEVKGGAVKLFLEISQCGDQSSACRSGFSG